MRECEDGIVDSWEILVRADKEQVERGQWEGAWEGGKKAEGSEGGAGEGEGGEEICYRTRKEREGLNRDEMESTPPCRIRSQGASSGPAPQNPPPQTRSPLSDPAFNVLTAPWWCWAFLQSYAYGYAHGRDHSAAILRLIGIARGRSAEYWGASWRALDVSTWSAQIPQFTDDIYDQQDPRTSGV